LLMTFVAEIICWFKSYLKFLFLKFKIWIVQTKSHEKMTKMKIVDLDDL
jgi:hypothetical protein